MIFIYLMKRPNTKFELLFFAYVYFVHYTFWHKPVLEKCKETFDNQIRIQYLNSKLWHITSLKFVILYDNCISSKYTSILIEEIFSNDIFSTCCCNEKQINQRNFSIHYPNLISLPLAPHWILHPQNISLWKNRGQCIFPVKSASIRL